MKETYILLYDGECGFCNFWVNWVMRNDRKGIFNFASLQGNFGQNFLTDKSLPLKRFNTLYLIEPNGEVHDKSNAVIKICRLLGSWYKLAVVFKIVPKFLRDKIYDLIAKNRRKLASGNCPLPTKEQRKMFLD
ncbi:Predicted thiol-disulfide oxidoreductase YuxK, DCC family [Paenimyroides ummariense]|uniref:Predicted thiol-disulfide oxidoreductase YuxK, DCC family n=1 Tax=Paenimyroides ummariense TaxID=913024 RepID=A0A1I4YHR2_9FLAO|nr:DCC1-like thiol-disulfide oxidoreductase family protein [Paenimyroides ummariense]SFN37547.1 Predicted thiol-disulfide oxidoreductase YuxK, DCC family [Paenimyroides ummariense]